MKFLQKMGVVASGVLATVGANAAAIDVTATVTDIAGQAAPIALIGAAVLGIFVALKGFKWVRRALA